MKSILQDKSKHQCYLCMMIDGDESVKTGLEEHHIYEGSARRELSEKYGLKVYLCKAHHTGDIHGSRRAVHRPDLNEYADFLHKEGQVAWMRDWMKKSFSTKQQAEALFRGIFGKSYIDIEEWEP